MKRLDATHQAPRTSAAPPPVDRSLSTPGVVRSYKILDHHLDRLAVVYVRQSSPQQVFHNRESRERQYALVDHAVGLGWSRDRVLVIDDDQGQSAKTAEKRTGFHRLLAEVTLEHVGLILGIEMSRLARSSDDWSHLLRMCGVFGTILADEDGIYDPNDSNDRLLLGLKGSISEYELITMRNRLERARMNKAERGELFQSVPTGYLKLSSERVTLDPDEQVREVIRLIFDKYDELRTVFGVFHYLLRNSIRLGIRPFRGPNRGQLEWRRPTMATIFNILRHPIYSGAYAYGRRPRKRIRTATGETTRAGSWVPMQQWKVLKRDCLPAYITWEHYLANQECLRQHRNLPDSTGTPRQGTALLIGLVVCGTCGRRLHANYGRRSAARYCCSRHLQEGVKQKCFGTNAAAIDDLVARQVLLALEPASLELSCQALKDVQQERTRLDRHWKQRLERARYEAQEAERRYRAVEPENRLVARTLEQRWEETLRAERQVRDDYDRFLREQPPQLSAEERARIMALSSDLPALWRAVDTTQQDRKEVVRHLVERVVVDVKKDSEYVDVTIHWHGGFTGQHEIVRPVRTYEQLRDFDKLLARIAALRQNGRTAVEIADQLNKDGFSPPKRCGNFFPELVRQLIRRFGLVKQREQARQLNRNEWWLPDLAEKLSVSASKLADWARRGWLHARQSPKQHSWILWADKDELKRLRKLAARSHRGVVGYPLELTQPKVRPIQPQAAK